MEDRAQWVTFTGDQRAIPETVLAYNTGQHPLQNAEQLAHNSMESIAKDLALNLAQFFR